MFVRRVNRRATSLPLSYALALCLLYHALLWQTSNRQLGQSWRSLLCQAYTQATPSGKSQSKADYVQHSHCGWCAANVVGELFIAQNLVCLARQPAQASNTVFALSRALAPLVLRYQARAPPKHLS